MKKSFTSITLMAAGVLGLASVSGSAGAATLDATGATFEFGVSGQTVSDSGDLDTPVPEGTAITYTNVATIDGSVLDAVVTYVDGTNLEADGESDYLWRLDDEVDGDEEDPYIKTNLQSDGNGEGIAEIRVDFFLTGTSTPATISNLSVNFYDIDNLQWVEVEGAAGYSVSSNTHLTVTNPSSGEYRFTSVDESTSDEDGTSFTVGRARVVYAASSSVTYRLGVAVNQDGSMDADFSTGLPWVDDFGGGEDTSNLPELPATGTAVGVMAGIAVAMIAGGAALGARRRTRA